MDEVAMGDADSVSVTKVGWDSNGKTDKLWKGTYVFCRNRWSSSKSWIPWSRQLACTYVSSQIPDFKSASIEESSNFSSENSKSCTMRPFQFYFIVNIYNLPIIFLCRKLFWSVTWSKPDLMRRRIIWNKNY